MKKILSFLGALTFSLLLGANVAAAAAFIVPQGGTGQATLTATQLLVGNGVNAIYSVATSSATCGTGASCTAFTIVGSGGTTITTTLGTSITVGELASADFGDWTCNGSTCTVDADSIALGTDTTGNYIATIAGTANQISVSGSGSETAAATLSLPSHVIFPGNFQVTNSTTTNATTTAIDITGLLTFNAVTGNSWDDFCVAITGGSGLCDGVDSTGGGGAGLATSTPIANTYVIYGTSAADVGAEAAFTYVASTDLLTVVNASTTKMSCLGSCAFGSTATSSFSTAGALTLATPLAVTSGGTGASSLNDLITLGTHTTGNYVATLSSSGSLTIGNSGSETAAVTANLNLGNANAWTALQSFSNASTTLFSNYGTAYFGTTATTTFSGAGNLTMAAASTLDASAAGSLRLPVSSAPTLGAAGSLALDSTSNNLVLATSTSGHIVVASATTTLYAYTATTSPIVSGTTMELPSHPLGQVATSIWCKVTSGTSLVINLSDGTNDTNTVTCTTTGTQYALTSNNTWTSYERINLEYGTKTGDTGDVVVRVMGYRTSD